MSRPICLINQPAGLGDILLCQKIAKMAIKKGYKIIWPVVKQYEYIGEYIKNENIEFCRIEDLFPGKHLFESDSKEYIQTKDFVYIPLVFADQIIKNHQSVLEAKYTYCNLTSDNWANYFEIYRNVDREKELEKYFKIKDEKFCVLNRIFATPPNIITNIGIISPPNIRTIEMKLMGWDRIFDWMGILEKAEEIHTVDTSLTLILRKLNVKNVHIYERTAGIGANYSIPNPNYHHKNLLCKDSWKCYTS